MKTALTIAGSDSSGGAGIQADLKTFSALGVFGMSAITAVTAQNTTGVRSVLDIPPPMVRDQMETVFIDIPVDAVKIGMLSSPQIIETVADTLTAFYKGKIILDPVMVSKSGYHLLQGEAVSGLKEKLFSLATVITPNIPEAEALLGQGIKTLDDLKKACKDLKAFGPEFVLVKGGHLQGDPTDVLFDGEEFYVFEGERIETKNTHGTGCTLSSAIAAYIALGYEMAQAIDQAKKYITGAIKHSLDIGCGRGPTHHFHFLEQYMPYGSDC